MNMDTKTFDKIQLDRAGGMAQVVEHLPSKCDLDFKPQC
jgi:hypothetical protein